MYPFTYKVLYLTEEEYYLECGMGFASDFGDAANQIEKYYSYDLVEIKSLILHEENSLIICPEEFCKDYYTHNGFYDNHVRCDEHGNPILEGDEIE